MAHYRLIIEGKLNDSESENDTLVTSTSSINSYGTSDTAIFKKDTSCTESEEESSRRTWYSTLGGQTNRTLFPSCIAPHEIYDPLREYPGPFDETVYARTDLLSTRKNIMTSSSKESFHEFTDNKKSTNSSLVTIYAIGDVKTRYKILSYLTILFYFYSVLTKIFSIWNTTMGSSILAMAWGIEKSGLFSGIFINLFVAAICLYTAYLLLNINDKHGIVDQNFEVPDLCRLLIGKWAETLAKTFSLVVLIGANIVYWVLMSNFLYNSVYFIYATITDSMQGVQPGVICYRELLLNTSILSYGSASNGSTFNTVWDLYSTVPLILGVVIFPFLNFKSPTFFTKFNSLGTISVGYLLVFTLVKSIGWGINIDDWSQEIEFKSTFFVLSGMLSLSYFIHNIIISVMKQNRHQENNGRDLIIAFSLVTFTYLFIGISFYMTFPLAKSCIEDNILNNFSKKDVMTIIARILLLFQIFTVFPLISYMLRCDILTNLNMLFKKKNYGEFSYKKVIFINFIVVFVCIMFACFYPRIGTLIRYTGALSGLVYIFFLPNLLQMATLKKENRLSALRTIFHVSIIIIGVANLVLQFFIAE